MAGRKSDSSALALRYAVALIEKAEEDDAIGAVESDFSKLGLWFAETEDLYNLISNPLVDSRRQIQTMAELASKAGLHKLTANFLGVLATNRRLSLLEDMIEAFGEEMSRRRGEIKAEVETAFELNETQLKLLKSELVDTLGSEVSINIRVKKELVGGLRIIVGSKMIDNTISRKLERLQRVLGGPSGKQLNEVS